MKNVLFSLSIKLYNIKITLGTIIETIIAHIKAHTLLEKHTLANLYDKYPAIPKHIVQLMLSLKYSIADLLK